MSRKSGFVAIVGRPNAGKSTILNSVLEAELSIVSPKAQTTRERVLGILSVPQGQIVFVDTPGIHKAREGGINAYMVQEAREALEAPNLVWYLVDPTSKLEHEITVLELLERSRSPVIVLMNKMDRAKNPELEGQLAQEFSERKIPLNGIRNISATKGTGIAELLAETWEKMPEGPLYYPDEEALSDRPTRFFVAEKIREQLYHHLGDELPYSCGVEIEKFDEKSKPPRIESNIYVERDSQKGMVVGKGGTKIKAIGQSARVEIEKFLGHQVFLGLKVKVLKDWTKDREAMKRFGYKSK